MTKASCSNTCDLQAIRFVTGQFSEYRDTVVVEKTVSIVVNGEEVVRLLVLPHQVELLVIGFLFSECLINGREDIDSLDFDADKMVVEVQLRQCEQLQAKARVRSITSAGTRGNAAEISPDATFYQPVLTAGTVAPPTIIELMRQFEKHSSLFRRTGGVHSAAAARNDELLFCSDDIGRHNALDKVIGWLLQNDFLSDRQAYPHTHAQTQAHTQVHTYAQAQAHTQVHTYAQAQAHTQVHTYAQAHAEIVFTSGRLPSEMVLKAVRGRFSIMVSPSAPTATAVQLATQFGLTLVGFARGDRFNVYTHPERIIGCQTAPADPFSSHS